MKIHVVKHLKPALSVGDLIGLYQKRIKKITFFDLFFEKELEFKKWKEKKKTSYFILLDSKGSSFNSSESFAKKIEKIQLSNKEVYFFIGGSYGFEKQFYDLADETWSLASITLQGDIALIVLMEQLYRSFCILSNHPYHH